VNPSLPGAAQLNTDLASSLREDEFQSLVLFDVDLFQGLNTVLGTKAGDRVLAVVQSLLEDYAGGVYRIGGDEYALLNVSIERASELRAAFRLLAGRQLQADVTMSGGGVAVDPSLLVSNDETVRVL
jgi:diguanylate cyclase (GGDEF)-like protein